MVGGESMWFGWMALSILLIFFDLFVFSGFFFLLGGAALLVSVLSYLGVVGSFPLQVFVFGLLSLTIVVLMRRHLPKVFLGKVDGISQSDLDDTGLLGCRVEIQGEAGPNQYSVSLNGAIWQASSGHPFKAGDSAKVVGNNGIILHIAPLD